MKGSKRYRLTFMECISHEDESYNIRNIVNDVVILLHGDGLGEDTVRYSLVESQCYKFETKVTLCFNYNSFFF